jgi:protocatechuate 3,4-dioxygenase beta subunit
MDRRAFLSVSLVMPVTLTLAQRAAGQARPTPACGAATVTQTEGPYFKASSPERQSLIEPSTKGTRIVVEGTVLDTDCRPMPKALIDVWHADAVGEYDNSGFRFRGHQYTDAEGKFRLQTIVPGNYPGRTRHFHVKVQAPGGRVLTTQLYFPDEPNNRRDGIFTPELVLKIRDVEGGRLGAFDFVLPKSRA